MNTAMDTLVMEPPSIYKSVAPPDAAITGRIHHIRGQKVMLDRDLAELYGVEVKRLKEQVRRNIMRFPEDFMFDLTLEEDHALRSQNATLKQGEHAKYPPFAFTEHGILMLANVLRSEQAITVSIHIIRVFKRTCLPAGRCAKCSFRTANSSRNWNNWKVASPATMRRSRPSSITSQNWSRQPNRRANPSASNPAKHEHRPTA
jgi:hypothetical protein